MIDVLTLNYNDSKTVIEFVNSIVRFPSVRKIIIVDNCSTDDSLKRLENIQSDKVDVVKSDKNGGYGAGNNLGIKYLCEKYESEYILLANPDVVISENTINELEKFIKNKPEYSVVAPMMTDADGVIQYNSAFKIPRLISYLISFELFLSRKIKPFCYKGIEKTNRSFCEVDSVAGSLFMMNAKDMLRFGLFDENVFLYSEELVLGIKFKNAGLKMALLANKSYVHNHSVSISKTYRSACKRNMLMNKSKLYVLKEYYHVNKVVLVFAYLLTCINLLESFVFDLFRKMKG